MGMSLVKQPHSIVQTTTCLQPHQGSQLSIKSAIYAVFIIALYIARDKTWIKGKLVTATISCSTTVALRFSHLPSCSRVKVHHWMPSEICSLPVSTYHKTLYYLTFVLWISCGCHENNCHCHYRSTNMQPVFNITWWYLEVVVWQQRWAGTASAPTGS